jgi:uncharacterized membrane protein
METAIQTFLYFSHRVIGLIGAVVVIWGIILVLWSLFRSECARCRGEDVTKYRELIRHQLSYYLLLGLEILIAADVLQTILKPTLQELASLGGIVVIRTLVSFTLNWELEQSLKREKR